MGDFEIGQDLETNDIVRFAKLGLGAAISSDEELRIYAAGGAPKFIIQRAAATARQWSVYVNGSGNLAWQDDTGANIMMALENAANGGDLKIDGSFLDTGASLGKGELTGNKKWKLLDSVVLAYKDHDLSKLSGPLKHNMKVKSTGKTKPAKCLSDIVQVQAECIVELKKEIDNLK